jgi:hypothetical protein
MSEETKPEGLPTLEEAKAMLGSQGWHPLARRGGFSHGALACLETVAVDLPLIFADFRDSSDWSTFPFLSYVEMYFKDLMEIVRGSARAEGWKSVINWDTLSACLCGIIMAFALLLLRVAAYLCQRVCGKNREIEREQVILRKVTPTSPSNKWLRRRDTNTKGIDWSSLAKDVEVDRVESGQEEYIALTVPRGRSFVELMLKLSELEQIEILEVSSRVEPVTIRVAGLNAGLLEMKRFCADPVRNVQFPCATPRRQYCLLTVQLNSVFSCLRAVVKEGGEVHRIYPHIP